MPAGDEKCRLTRVSGVVDIERTRPVATNVGAIVVRMWSAHERALASAASERGPRTRHRCTRCAVLLGSAPRLAIARDREVPWRVEHSVGHVSSTRLDSLGEVTSTGGVRVLAVVAALLGLLWVALPAMACSRMPPLELGDLLGGTSWAGQIDGVFEYQHISWTPHLGYRDSRSVSIVTRYWGSEPKESGLQIHGDHNILMTNSCPNGSASLGATGYSMVDPDEPSIRTAELIAVAGQLSPAQATLLEDRFGATGR